MRTVCKSFLYVLAVGFLVTSISLAEGEKKGPKGRHADCARIFARMDTDKSGGVTIDEFKAHRAARMAARQEGRGERERPEGAKTPPTDEEVFSRIDGDGDGLVSQEELEASVKRHGGGKGRHGRKKEAETEGTSAE